MSLTLAQAAEQVGLNRSTILRAVKAGKISGTRDDAGVWHVDPAELFRVFEPAQPEAEVEPQHALTNALVAELRARLDDPARRVFFRVGCRSDFGILFPRYNEAGAG